MRIACGPFCGRRSAVRDAPHPNVREVTIVYANLRRLLLLAIVLVVAGCASTTIRDAWLDTTYTGPPFHKIIVAGVHGTLADRRVFEDVFSNRLRAAGVEAIPGYRLLPDAQKADEARWNAAVAQSGADGVLMVRLLGVATRTQVSTIVLPRGWRYGWGWYGWYPGWVAVPEIQQYDVATVETTLLDVASKRVVWAATSETFNPGSVAQETPGFADVIIAQLAQRHLIAAAAH